MYPQCRYLRSGNQVCRAVAVRGTPWCYYHGRLHQRYRAQNARHRLHNQRDASGRFTPAHHHSMDARPGQSSHPHPAPADSGLAAAAPHAGEYHPPQENTREHPTRPSSHFPRGEAGHHPPLALPPIAGSASIQLALSDVLEALAANQLDPRRASVLLYGLQVASTNTQHAHAKPASKKQPMAPGQPPS